ncbi:MAG: hypothetical protein JWO36_1249, partial [Myxococcales bacterium]|nr:hypothetical protein [Myxococcales bacterium]
MFVIAVTFLLALRPRVAGPRVGTAAQSDSVRRMTLVSNFIAGKRMLSGSLARLPFLSLPLVGCTGASAGLPASPGDARPAVDVRPPPNIDGHVEPVWHPDQEEAREKTPNAQMHITAGMP